LVAFLAVVAVVALAAAACVGWLAAGRMTAVSSASVVPPGDCTAADVLACADGADPAAAEEPEGAETPEGAVEPPWSEGSVEDEVVSWFAVLEVDDRSGMPGISAPPSEPPAPSAPAERPAEVEGRVTGL